MKSYILATTQELHGIAKKTTQSFLQGISHTSSSGQHQLQLQQEVFDGLFPQGMSAQLCDMAVCQEHQNSW